MITSDSPKADVLAAVLAGKKIHKISPAFPVNWNEDEIAQMSEHVFSTGESLRAHNQKPPEIPAVNYQNKPISGGLLQWVNRVRLRYLFKYNPYIVRGGRIKPGSRTNRQLWREASRILLAEYKYWSQKLIVNRRYISTGRGFLVEYPKVCHLPFRDNDVFVGGEWSNFGDFWDEFIESMK